MRLTSKILTLIQVWREVAVERSELLRMNDEALKDIGISRAEAIREASRHFWDTAPLSDAADQSESHNGPKLFHN